MFNRLNIKEYEELIVLNACIKTDKIGARGLRKIVEKHYQNDDKENPLFSRTSQSATFLDGNILNRGEIERPVFLKNSPETGFVYKCSTRGIKLHTSSGYLTANIGFIPGFNDRDMSITAEGEKDFVLDFYNYLTKISR